MAADGLVPRHCRAAPGEGEGVAMRRREQGAGAGGRVRGRAAAAEDTLGRLLHRGRGRGRVHMGGFGGGARDAMGLGHGTSSVQHGNRQAGGRDGDGRGVCG